MSSTHMLYGSLIKARRASRARRIEDEATGRYEQPQIRGGSRRRRGSTSFDA